MKTTTEKNALLCTISIPWKCVCRCSSGSKMKGNKTEMYHWTLEEKKKLQSMKIFFPSLNNIKVNITVTPNV